MIMATIWDDWKDTALKNGIDRQLFESRIWTYHYSEEEAATIPKGKHRRGSMWKRWKEVAEANGIKRSTFYSRIYNYHMTPTQAATEPLKRRVTG